MYRSTRLLILAAVLAAAIVVPFLVLGREPVLLDEAERTSRGGRFIRLSDGYTHADVAGPDSAATAIRLANKVATSFFMQTPLSIIPMEADQPIPDPHPGKISQSWNRTLSE